MKNTVLELADQNQTFEEFEKAFLAHPNLQKIEGTNVLAIVEQVQKEAPVST